MDVIGLHVHVCVSVFSEVRAHDGIELVITLVKVEQAVAVESAITVLINMSVDKQLTVDIVDCNVIPAFIQALSFRLACLLMPWLHVK